jgi:diadenosine tetraphosphatase ApaH/serine/threonine PP2A family protein phosphatase
VAWLRAQGIPTIMGNYDLGVGHDSDDCGCAYKDAHAEALGQQAIGWSNAHTNAENKAYLRRLLPAIPLQEGDLRVRLVHGSPRKVNEYLYADRPDSSLERLLDLAEADVLVCGHPHIPYHRVLPSGRHVVNVGRVGKPQDGDPRACYITLDAQGAELQVAFIRVPYDIERASQAIEASAMPNEYAAMLRTAEFFRGSGRGRAIGAADVG